MKHLHAQEVTVAGVAAARRTTVSGRGILARCAVIAAMSGVGCIVPTGCAGNEQDVVLTGTTASQPNIPIVSSPTTPGPNDPLSLFEQRRLLARIQRDPQHQLQRLSARERRGLAAMAEATRKKDDDE